MIPLPLQVFLRKVLRDAPVCAVLIIDLSHSNQVGDVQKDKLPGSEALLEPGKKDGQVYLI